MYSTSEALTNAIINGEPINKELRLLDSDGVVIKTIKSLKLYSGSNSTSRIQIGSTNSSYIEASIEYDKVLANREMALYCGIDSEMIPMGIYKIMQEPSEDDGIISFKAYDRMRLLDKLYEPTVAIPNGFKAVVDDIAKQCGVTVNFSYTAENVRNFTKGYTCREMIGYIASMLGTFAYFDRQGVLNFGWYNFGKPVEKTLSSFWSLKKNSSDYKVTGVEFIVNSDTKWLSGSEPNIIYCSNPLAEWGNAENVYYGPMKDLTYRPAEISMLDDIRLDVTDVVKVTLLDGTTIEVPCMTLNQDFTASETKVKAVGNADGEASNYSGPLTTAMDRMTTDLLLTNRVVATKVDADWVRANTVTVDKITAIQAEIDEINANNITTDNLSANVAKLGYMSADEADIKYANIKLTNIETANVATLFAKIGLIDRATVVEGHITGFLDSVEVNANKITAGTLIADRILLKGSEKGLLYALNNLGELTSTTVDSLDGYVLTDRTINADKIVASSITANELDVANIFANNAVISTITSQEAFINAISTNSVVVGAKKTADEIKENIYSPNTTTIDGGKITTNSIKAKQIDVANLFAQDITATGTITGATLKGAKAEINSGSIGGFALTEKLTATGTAYLPPTLSDFNTIKNAMANGTIGSLYSQNVWWDINGDGKTDVYDFGYMRNMILGKSEYKDYAHKKLSNVTIEISPNSTDKSIRIYGTNAWGSLIETYIGIDEVATNSIKANSYISVGGDTWNADGISSTGDIIAGVGTSNQVSLQGLKDSFVKVTGTTRSSTSAGTSTELDYPTGFTRDNSMVVGFEIQVGNDWYSTDTNGKFPQPILGRKIWVDNNNCASTWASRPFRIMLIKM